MLVIAARNALIVALDEKEVDGSEICQVSQNVLEGGHARRDVSWFKQLKGVFPYVDGSWGYFSWPLSTASGFLVLGQIYALLQYVCLWIACGWINLFLSLTVAHIKKKKLLIHVKMLFFLSEYFLLSSRRKGFGHVTAGCNKEQLLSSTVDVKEISPAC